MELSNRNRLTIAGVGLMVVLVVLGALVHRIPIVARLNLLLYDTLLPVQRPAMSEDVLVIAIDNRSLEALGRWPWDRGVHAQLLYRLEPMKPKAIGLDVLFAERNEARRFSDQRLVSAVARAPVVLPVAPSLEPGTGLITELLPFTDLALEASALAHVDVELDRDGQARSTFLYGGLGGANWPSLSLAMLQLGDPERAAAYGQPPEVSGSAAAAGWVRASPFLIPFSGPERGPKMVSFSDVLEGRVSPQEIRNKFVLVGVTATGLGDAISSPGAPRHERIPGVVLAAEILNGLLNDRMITELSGVQSMLVSALLVGASVLAIVALPTHLGLPLALLGAGLSLALAALLLSVFALWFPPAGALCGVLLAWPLWTTWQQQRSRRLAQRLQKQLDHQAQYSLDTGLPNSGMLGDRLRSLGRDDLHQGASALMVVHMHWPDTMGLLDRSINDPVLRVIGEKIKASVHKGDFVAHLHGEDFAVLTSGLNNKEEVQAEATKLLTALEQPVEYNGEHRLLMPEIGVSVWPMDSRDPAELIRNAYTAMLKARIDDGNNLCMYSESVGSEVQTRSQLEQALIFALERREFEVFYQPQVAADDGRIIGVEALLRWENPLLGRVSPDTFVPVAENVGLIKSIGAWVIEETCSQLKLWNEAGFQDLRLAINVSPLQFLVPGLEEDIQLVIQRVGVEPSKVELEITESSLMQDINRAVQVMGRIKENGLELAIDDFGTGYSSLSNLRRFPLDRLKIDQAFTHEIGVNAEAEKITLTIIDMAQHLGLNTIAEGVETEDQAAFLRGHGCDEFQGFLYGRPMPAQALTELLESSTAS